MNDETKDELMRRTREWLQSCVNAATRSGVPEEADLEAFILAHLDGEPERIAAALGDRLKAAEAERDEAVAALREMFDKGEGCAACGKAERAGCGCRYERARAVLAKYPEGR